MNNLKTNILTVGESPKGESLKVTVESLLEKLDSRDTIDYIVLFPNTVSAQIVWRKKRSLFHWDLELIEKFGFKVRSIGVSKGQLSISVQLECLK